MANGEAVPSNVIGILNRSKTDRNDPIIAANCMRSNALLANLRIGRDASGMTPMNSADQMRITKKVSYFGDRSAHFPPMEYPTDR